MTSASMIVRLALFALALACLLGLLHVLEVLGLQVPFDPNEGWNAYFAQLAMNRGTPYPPDGGLLVNNYPPLSFYLVGGVGSLLGDNIVGGRVVSLLAFLCSAGAIGAAARRMGTTRKAAAFASLLFMAWVFLTSDYAGMNDPQLLGHAVALSGLVLALEGPRTARSMVLVALLLTIAFFVKHNLILLPLSLAMWLLLVDRKHAFILMASGVAFLLLGLGAFRVAFSTSLLHQIASARLYSFHNLAMGLLNWLPFVAVPLVAALGLMPLARRDQRIAFALVYLVTSVVGGSLFLSGAGVDTNALFDADIALALCAGLLLDRLGDESWSAATAIAYLVPLAFFSRSIAGDWTNSSYWLHPLAEERAAAEEDIGLLRRVREPVMCETLALCYWAGKSPQVDVFNTDQRIRSGALNGATLARQISARKFSLIQLEALEPYPLPPPIAETLKRNYRIVRRSDEGVFLAPR